jgi:hypothetical protein
VVTPSRTSRTPSSRNTHIEGGCPLVIIVAFRIVLCDPD